jgi:cation diffusion facilitator CzcD-associated flavoprotein CzcO
MTTSSRDCQVLVVGAGPTGLVLSAQLLARGIDTRIVDKGNGPARESRAVSVHARTLELLDTMGLAEAFIEHGHRGRRYRMYAGNPEPAQPGHTPPTGPGPCRRLVDVVEGCAGARDGFGVHLGRWLAPERGAGVSDLQGE